MMMRWKRRLVGDEKRCRSASEELSQGLGDNGKGSVRLGKKALSKKKKKGSRERLPNESIKRVLIYSMANVRIEEANGKKTEDGWVKVEGKRGREGALMNTRGARQPRSNLLAQCP